MPPDNQHKPYEAFISYSHAADGRLAPAVQSALKRFARPRYRWMPIFRDETNLSLNPRLRSAIEKDRVEVKILSDHLPTEDQQPETYAACNRKILREAITKAQLLDEEPILLAVRNGNPADGTGGTADAVRGWQVEGCDVDLIDISKL